MEKEKLASKWLKMFLPFTIKLEWNGVKYSTFE